MEAVVGVVPDTVLDATVVVDAVVVLVVVVTENTNPSSINVFYLCTKYVMTVTNAFHFYLLLCVDEYMYGICSSRYRYQYYL